jgi:hypothetical protein
VATFIFKSGQMATFFGQNALFESAQIVKTQIKVAKARFLNPKVACKIAVKPTHVHVFLTYFSPPTYV